MSALGTIKRILGRDSCVACSLIEGGRSFPRGSSPGFPKTKRRTGQQSCNVNPQKKSFGVKRPKCIGHQRELEQGKEAHSVTKENRK
ncbi:hypothetical protein NDU88_010685 [Pleurodeles waltl]|uniref:Uncharacterized protein n=1 Tax=Pleurodeles waltl TaxID=8319 RepID=A0AAV7PYN4_PLEWA|nr:hypothetical protein NDU88_010685 [Pleurodeles waltl]